MTLLRSVGSKMVRGFSATLKSSAAETASATHGTVNTKLNNTVTVTVDVTARSGTSPTLLVTVEGSNDGGTTWHVLGKIGSDGYSVGSVATDPADFTAVASKSGVYPAPALVRTKSVVGGTTPSFTYSVVADVS